METSPGSHQGTQEIVRRLADRSSMFVWESDAEGICTYLNPEATQGLVGLGSVNVSAWMEVIHPDDRQRVQEAVRQARADRKEYSLEYRVQRSDGTVRWMLSNAAPRLSPEGELLGYLGTIIDVTESHDARSALIRSETEHRLLTENARDMISYSDANNVYVYASPSHKETLGYDPEELVGTYLYDYIHPDDLKEETATDPAQHGARRRLVNIRFRHKDGRWIWLSASTRTVRDKDTGAKLGIVSIARDITAQLEAQRELARREERFRSLTSLSSDWYWETDTKLHFTFLSDGLLNRLGIDPAKLLGTSLDAHVHNRTAPGFVSCMESIAAHKPFYDIIYPAESPDFPGVVRFLRISGEPFYDDGEFVGYRGVSRDVTREVRTATALERLATSDPLTELPNRALLQTCLKQRLQEKREQTVQAIFFIDLDNFKEVNDSLGHAAGDLLLKEIARRLRACVRAEDVVARLGGDEFVVLAECKDGEASAARMAEQLLLALDAPFVVRGHEVKAGASVGISLYPQDGRSSEALLQNADTALYRAKASGGARFSFYSPRMSEASKSRMMLQGALRHALERDEFEIYYQPRMNLRSFEMTGMEALLRWTHPQIGEIPPTQFIPLAEESGLIDAIGEWVLQHATIQTQKWSTRFQRPLKVSVNLSAHQLRRRELIGAVTQALRASGLPPHQLELELTETGLMEDPEVAANLLKELKSIGLKLSVDDFGTGYSSLAYLCRFPLDSLKLDRSFLLRPDAADANPWRLAEAIINLAHTLNLVVIAEGVENDAHIRFLRNTSCDEVQGTSVSEPLSRVDFEELLVRQALLAQGHVPAASPPV
jgi:diguanylate cyclase (GGDEF)-like protein/PAS domain S-box-containing protein